MSMMRCAWCDSFTDTDYDVEGAYETKGTRFMCSECCEERDIDSDQALDAYLEERAEARALPEPTP